MVVPQYVFSARSPGKVGNKTRSMFAKNLIEKKSIFLNVFIYKSWCSGTIARVHTNVTVVRLSVTLWGWDSGDSFLTTKFVHRYKPYLSF